MALFFRKQKGFTLIELLLVISIISLLSTIILATFGEARKQARDAARFQNIQQINTAIQLYISDYGHAPYLGSVECKETNDAPDTAICEALDYNSNWSTLASELSPYIPSLPRDPCGISCPDASDTKFYDYVYLTPAMETLLMGAINPNGYQLYANELETRGGKYGFKTFDYGW